MKSPQIHCIVDNSRSQLVEYLRNLGAIADIDNANIILTDNPVNLKKGWLCFLITDQTGMGYISIHRDASNQAVYQIILQVASSISNMEKGDYTPKFSGEITPKETALVGGFARHFSHNVLNSLLATGGYLRQIKAVSDKSEHSEALWNTVDDKLRSIEELVNGYNDYNHVLTLRLTEKIDMVSFFHDLTVATASKKFEKAFSAYLSHYTNRYTITYDYKCELSHVINANPLFLKLAFSYIIKDTVKYVESAPVVHFHVSSREADNKFILEIQVNNTNMPPEIIASMFKPWYHDMLTQSFDYWGIAIAQAIIARHDGVLTAENINKNLVYTITL